MNKNGKRRKLRRAGSVGGLSQVKPNGESNGECKLLKSIKCEIISLESSFGLCSGRLKRLLDFPQDCLLTGPLNSRRFKRPSLLT